jgi:hypothetical protein
VLKNVTRHYGFVQYLQILLSRFADLVLIRMDPYYYRKLNLNQDPHESEKMDPDPDSDPH